MPCRGSPRTANFRYGSDRARGRRARSAGAGIARRIRSHSRRDHAARGRRDRGHRRDPDPLGEDGKRHRLPYGVSRRHGTRSRTTGRVPPEPATWNDGSARGNVARAAVDDVGFVAALIDVLSAGFGADPAAIFLTGFSNGASLAFRSAAELPGRIRAIAPVAGHCWVDPPAGSATSLLYLIGDSDPLNPIEGGEVATPWGGQERHPAPRRSFSPADRCVTAK